MARTTVQRSLIILGAAGSLLALSACGGATENGLESFIESQAGGDVDLDLSGDGGFSVQTEEGGMSIDEDGNFVITGADGEVVTGDVDAEGGDFNVETEDGSFSSGATNEIPDNWPGDVPQPDGLAIINATSMESTDGASIQVTGGTDDVGSFVDAYASQLESAGFTSEAASAYEGEESWVAVYEGPYTVILNVIAFEGSDPAITVSVISSP
jgi:hypothetical protein